MADIRLVHNTTPYALVVSARGVRVLGNTSREIDITQPRAQKYLASGDLILVSSPEPAPAPEPAPEPTEEPTRAASKSSGKPAPTTTNGE